MALPGDPRKTLVSQPSSPWRAALERWVRIIQGNFDHMDGVITQVQNRHNNLDDNVQQLAEFVNENLDAAVEHTHTDDSEGGTLDHADLTNVTAGQHHAEDHDHDGSPTQQLLAANTHGSPGADTHHNKAHDHTTADGSGVLTADEHDSFSEYAEIADPSAPAANKGRLYFKDNGAGKTQLAVLFPSGAVQVVVTEP